MLTRIFLIGRVGWSVLADAGGILQPNHPKSLKKYPHPLKFCDFWGLWYNFDIKLVEIPGKKAQY
jgi:hypothetical protein